MTGDGKTLAVVILSICLSLAAMLIGLGIYEIAGPANDWIRHAVADLHKRAIDASQPIKVEVRPADTESSRPVPPVDTRLANSGLKGNPGQWFGDDAYPADAIRAGEQGRTVARLGIDPSGTPTSCAIVVSSGSRSLDVATCTIALRRVTFQPARNAQGEPVASSFTLPVRWVLPTR